MKITALMLVRNEAWILPYTLRAALLWCDNVLVLDHGSTDATAEIATDPRWVGTVRYEHEPEPRWLEMDFRHRMCELARMRGTTHFAMVDADECPTGNRLAGLRDLAADLAPGYALRLPMVCPWRGTEAYRVGRDTPYGDRACITTIIADHPAVGWSPAADGYQLHSRAPRNARGTFEPWRGPQRGGVFHLQWLAWDRLLWKQRRYVLRDLSAYQGREPVAETVARYTPAIDEANLATAPIPPEWWAPYGGPPPAPPPGGGWYEDDARAAWVSLPPSVQGDLPGWVRAPFVQ